MRSLRPGCHAVVAGAGGGIGAALVRALAADPSIGLVTALSRRPDALVLPDRVRRGRVELEDEASIAEAAAALPSPPRLVIVATGLLQDDAMRPEKTFRAIDPAQMLRAFQVNAVGPALLARHLLPAMPTEGRAVFAALGARVGSIGDNRSGGWHSYRASKAALAMILRTLSIELARRTPELLCVGLHPGTVATGLSRPFQSGVPANRLFTPAFAAERLLAVIDGLDPACSGSVLAWDGQTVPP